VHGRGVPALGRPPGDEYLNPLAFIATTYELRLKPWDG